MSNQQKPVVRIKRFSKAFVWAHAVNAISFFALYITALPMYTDFFNWLYPVLVINKSYSSSASGKKSRPIAFAAG